MEKINIYCFHLYRGVSAWDSLVFIFVVSVAAATAFFKHFFGYIPLTFLQLLLQRNGKISFHNGKWTAYVWRSRIFHHNRSWKNLITKKTDWNSTETRLIYSYAFILKAIWSQSYCLNRKLTWSHRPVQYLWLQRMQFLESVYLDVHNKHESVRHLVRMNG